MKKGDGRLTVAKDRATSSLFRLRGIIDDSVNLIPTAMMTDASTIQVTTLTTGPRFDGVAASRLFISMSSIVL